ncbi:polysaccharide biosynthesis protein [Pedobacter sp. JY14-1]|uniref:polysaccharide biosynthesis protein n=1 Tax=Pedobacter sp. JY14-1 TaxID=3034151 RepID=UPI0023E3474E|nr:polysaccharide biosynthesis protein [Pedobacter sp. JY14-1]
MIEGLARWSSMVSVTGFAQVLVQLLGLAGGILIVRWLPAPEFALYTLANSMLATVVVLADSGIGAGILAAGGKVSRDRLLLGRVIVTGVGLRRRFAWLTLMIALPVLLYLLIRHHAEPLKAGLIVLSVVPAFYAALTDTLYEIPLKLNQDVVALQRNQLEANVSRFLALVVMLYFIPYTLVAMLCGGLSRLLANVRLRKRAGRFADLDQEGDGKVRSEVVMMLKRTLPSTVYYCLSGQITVWLISVFGNTESIAQVGALERVASVLGLVSSVFYFLIVPRFAQLFDRSYLLMLRFAQVLGLLTLICAGVCGLSYFFAGQVLFILGHQYRHLDMALLLVMVSGCLKLTAGIANYLSVSRGWAIEPVLYITVSVVVQVVAICMLDLSVLHDVLLLSIVNGAIALLLYCGYFFYRSFKLRVAGI